MRFVTLALLLAAVSAQGQEKVAGLAFIECTIYIDGDALEKPAMFYVDEREKRLLDRRKKPFGTTEYWTPQTIRVLNEGELAHQGPLVFSIDRLTGDYEVYFKNSPIESMLRGKCVRKATPTPKF